MLQANAVTGPPSDAMESIPQSQRSRALFGSTVGSIVEWYDFFLYGTMAAVVFGPEFFPTADPVVSQLLAMISFALAFGVRPLGAIIFSHLGDKYGRKSILIVTLSIMGVATVGIGCVPTYATIGVAAPILLISLRLLQGLALGGEWGGGLLMAVEYSPPKRRGLYGSVVQIGVPLGLALGNLAITAGYAVFGAEAFIAGGWRIAFFLSIILVVVGLWIRAAVDETPSFKAVKAAGNTVKLPLATVFKTNWREVLIVLGAKAIETGSFFLYATFIVSHLISLKNSDGSAMYTAPEALNIVLVAAIIAVPVMLAVGALSDRIGRRKIFATGTVLAMVWPFLLFGVVGQGNWLLALVAVVLGLGVIWPLCGAVLGSYFAESFPTRVRYTGVSLGNQIGAALFGGPLPAIALALVASFHSTTPVSLLICGFGILSLIAVAFTRDRTGQPLED